MSLAFRLKMAKQKGEALVRERKIESLPVDPFLIATDHDIVVEAKPDTGPGVSGMLLRHGEAFGILYATHIPSEGCQRFSVGHELGHYFLDGHIDHILPHDGVHASYAGYVSADPYEREADHFSAGLLMPRNLFRREIGRFEPGFVAIESAADLCRTSLTATAIRYAELTEDAVAVIMSTGNIIDYCFLSDTIKRLPQLSWLRKGMPVPKTSATAKFNVDPRRVLNADRVVANIDILDWLGGNRSVEAIEEVVGLGGYGKTLTVLTCPSLVDETYQDEDDNEEAALLESWTPRFRR